MLDEKEKQDFIKIVKGKKIAGSWWKDEFNSHMRKVAYYIPTGRIFDDAFESSGYSKDDLYISTDRCQFKNGFSDHYGTQWMFYYENVLKPEIKPPKECKHENKKEVKMIFTSYWLCEDCGKDFDLP